MQQSQKRDMILTSIQVHIFLMSAYMSSDVAPLVSYIKRNNFGAVAPDREAVIGFSEW